MNRRKTMNIELENKYTEKEIDLIIESFINYKAEEKEAKAKKEALQKVLENILRTKTNDEYTTENHKMWLTLSERKTFDENGLKEKYPEIWKEFASKKAIVSFYAK